MKGWLFPCDYKSFQLFLSRRRTTLVTYWANFLLNKVNKDDTGLYTKEKQEFLNIIFSLIIFMRNMYKKTDNQND